MSGDKLEIATALESKQRRARVREGTADGYVTSASTIAANRDRNVTRDNVLVVGELRELAGRQVSDTRQEA
jgi:hypothetical protein